MSRPSRLYDSAAAARPSSASARAALDAWATCHVSAAMDSSADGTATAGSEQAGKDLPHGVG